MVAPKFFFLLLSFLLFHSSVINKEGAADVNEESSNLCLFSFKDFYLDVCYLQENEHFENYFDNDKFSRNTNYC